MLKAYDVGVKKLIEVFAPNIKVIGLQNDDSTDTSESVMSQAGKNSPEDKISFPIISVFRNPSIEIIDGAMTKRSSTYQGYQVREGDRVLSLVTLRANLEYTIDVFEVTRAAAEEIALKLFFRLRNNPEIVTTFDFDEYGYSLNCTSTIQLEDSIENQRVNSADKIQCSKLRFSFKLANVNIYDLLDKDAPEIHYSWSISHKKDNSI